MVLLEVLAWAPALLEDSAGGLEDLLSKRNLLADTSFKRLRSDGCLDASSAPMVAMNRNIC